MKIFKLFITAVLLVLSVYAFAGLGDGSSGNETGGFGGSSEESAFGSSSFGQESFGVLECTDCPPPGGEPPLPPAIPIDGGASLIIAAGLGLGGRKLYKKFADK